MNTSSLNTRPVTTVSSLTNVLLHLQRTLHLAATWIRGKWKHYRMKTKLTLVI